jgi:tRNA A-37 threonylcarbamoyl transferase component Bud32/tetratricopeptide (TPR) repeat protein
LAAGRPDAAVADDALRAEALRLNTRYVNEVVLAWDLCPWAEKAFASGQVRQRVNVSEVVAPEDVLPFLDELEAAPGIAIGLLIFPRLVTRAAAFDAFAERVRRADHARRPGGATSPPAPSFLIAAFHPGAPDTFATPPQLVSFVRRTPDPTLQLVRTSLLRRATGDDPRVSDEVTRRNFETVSGRGAAALDAVLRDLRRDRDESYARLGLEQTAAASAADTSPGPRLGLSRGESVGRFVLVSLLGRGGMGEVYAAYDPELDRKVAVKILRARSADGEARLLREAQAIAKLQHPNVVVVYDVGKFRDTVFIAMEFVDGETLGHWMKEEARPWRETLRIFQAAGRGLDAAHALGMVHRDFKPDNVMLTKDGQVRVMDFGLARQVDDGADEIIVGAAAVDARPDAAPEATMPLGQGVVTVPVPPAETPGAGGYLKLKLTQTGEQVGTPAYMAPEQFAAQRSDARTDQFSFCVALYEALYGQRPFAGDTVLTIMASVAEGAVRPAPEKARVPSWIRRVLLRGLATNPEVRFPSMQALLAALESDPSARRRRWALAVLGVAAVGGVTFAASRIGAGRGALCLGGGARLAGIWESGDAPSARKGSIHAAFSKGGKSYAAGAYTGAARLLDEYVGRWTAMYRDTCEATVVRGEQSAEVLDLRMACLNERLENLRALTDVFANADDGVVQNAVSGAGALPRLDACADVAALRTVVKPPRDSATARRVDAERAELARVIALRDSGQCGAAEKRVAPLIENVRAVGYQPLLAEVLQGAGAIGKFCGDPAVAVDRLKGSYAAAVAGRLDAVAPEVAAGVALLAFNRLGDSKQTLEWVPIARASFNRLGHADPVEAPVLFAEGTLEGAERNFVAMIAKVRQAHAITARAFGVDHPFALEGLMTIGDALLTADRVEEALATDRDALERAARVYGPSHSVVAAVASNMGEALNRLGRFSEARVSFERALTVWREIGAGEFLRSYGLTGLGKTFLGAGNPGDAVAPLEGAVAARVATKAAPSLLGESRFALARALWSRSSDRPRALSLAGQARADYGSDPKAVAEIDVWLAKPSAK